MRRHHLALALILACASLAPAQETSTTESKEAQATQPATGAESQPAAKPADSKAGDKQTTALEIQESPIAPGNYRVTNGTRQIDTVVLHYASAIYWFSDPGLQQRLTDEAQQNVEEMGLTPQNLPQFKYDYRLVKAIFEAYGVSSHYFIARDGTVYRFVQDKDVAYHAGASKMPTDGREGVNNFSIGIEMGSSHPNEDSTVKTPDDAYTPAQYASLELLMKDLCAKYPITAVVGHDEIAPTRKTDPGPLFQWSKVRDESYAPTACRQQGADGQSWVVQ